MKLVIITRTDITNGYQCVQSTHGIADFIFEFPEESKRWKEESNSIICLGVKNEDELLKIFYKYCDKIPITLFREPDINNQATSLCLFGESETRKKLRHLPLIGKIDKSNSISDLHLKMSTTPQTDKQSVLEHGISVSKYFNDIVSILEGGANYIGINIPDHFISNKKFILDNLYDKNISNKYHLYHDCGKPYCIEYDDAGKRHFPDHEKKSHETYLKYFGCEENSDIISQLILHDMDFHILKPSGVEQYLIDNVLDKKTIITLLVSCLAELNSNAMMFGGYDSDSFKIKMKNFNKVSKRIIDYYLTK